MSFVYAQSIAFMPSVQMKTNEWVTHRKKQRFIYPKYGEIDSHCQLSNSLPCNNNKTKNSSMIIIHI